MNEMNKSWVEQALLSCKEKVLRNSERIGASFPHVSQNGAYDSTLPSWWTAGFWPGLLWLTYQYSGESQLKDVAMECEALLAVNFRTYHGLDHDIGFIYSLSSVAQFKLTGDEGARTNALHAANLLAGRFNLRGRYIRAWQNWGEKNNADSAIIDCLMNLPILYWASEQLNDPRYKHIAIAHADTALKHFVREDSSVYHIVKFDPETGERTGAIGGQGFAEHSAWARGASWAVYGFALSFRYTGDRKYLEAAKNVAHFFIANLPEDHVPYWDFRLPTKEGMPRDTSAGACAASGMLEIAKLVPAAERELYQSAGERIVKSLYEHYSSWAVDEEGILLHGTVNYPAGKNVDVPIIYGDYFFVEALLKLQGEEQSFW
jgi:unsaturated chondroitin disaccharide hydrolase